MIKRKIRKFFYGQADPLRGSLRIYGAHRFCDRSLDTGIFSLKLNHAVFQTGSFQKIIHQPLHFSGLCFGMFQKFLLLFFRQCTAL